MPKEKDKIPSLDAKPEEIVNLIERVRAGKLTGSDSVMIERLLRLLLKLVWVTKAKDATVGKLRSLLFWKKTERREEPKNSKETKEDSEKKPKDDGSAKRKGHGRMGSERYVGATEVVVTDERLRVGGLCPEPNCGGRLFDLGETRIVLEGRPIVDATKYVMPVFVCSRCRVRVATPAPDEAREKKFAGGGCRVGAGAIRDGTSSRPAGTDAGESGHTDCRERAVATSGAVGGNVAAGLPGLSA